MMEYFCPHCGIKTNNNTHGGVSGDHILSCSCNFVMRFYILPSSQLKTYAEIEKEFAETPLTESQEFGSKAKKGRRKIKQ